MLERATPPIARSPPVLSRSVFSFAPETALTLGATLQRKGLVPQAEELTRKSLESDAEGANAAIAVRLFHVGCLVRLGRIEESQRGLGLVARMAGRWGNKPAIVALLAQQAELHLMSGSFSSAQALASHALANLEPTEPQSARLAVVNAWVDLRDGHLTEAIDYAASAAQMATTNDPIQVEAAVIIAWAEWRRGHTRAAQTTFARAGGYAQRLDDDYHRGRMMALCATFSGILGRGTQADQYLKLSRASWPGTQARITIDNGPWWWTRPVRVTRSQLRETEEGARVRGSVPQSSQR